MKDEIHIASLIIKHLKGNLSADEQTKLQEWVSQSIEHQALIETFVRPSLLDEAERLLLERDEEAIEKKLLARLGWKELPAKRRQRK